MSLTHKENQCVADMWLAGFTFVEIQEHLVRKGPYASKKVCAIYDKIIALDFCSSVCVNVVKTNG